MTFLKLSLRGRALSAAVTLVLVAGFLLASCTGLRSSIAVVSQGSATATLEKPSNAKSTTLADLHGTVEVKKGDGKWTLAQSGQTLKAGNISSLEHCRT